MWREKQGRPAEQSISPPYFGGALTRELVRLSHSGRSAGLCSQFLPCQHLPPLHPVNACVTRGGGKCFAEGWVWVACQVWLSATSAPPPASLDSAPPGCTRPHSQDSAAAQLTPAGCAALIVCPGSALPSPCLPPSPPHPIFSPPLAPSSSSSSSSSPPAPSCSQSAVPTHSLAPFGECCLFRAR